MLNYIKNSIKRKLARRFTKNYPSKIDVFNLPEYGAVKFVNWENPLFEERKIKIEDVKFFKNYIKEGDFIIDIGANIGHMSVLMSLLAGKNGLTLAFDPNPFVFNILQQNACLNPNLMTVKAYNYAITENDGEFYYHSSEASFSNGGISDEDSNKHGKYKLKQKIKGINLNNFLNTNFSESLNKLKFIKIDTEGYDKDILKSISDILIKYKPTVVSECFGKLTESERDEYYEIFISKGYKLFHVEDFVENAVLTPILTSKDMLKWRHFDVIAIFE